MDEKLHLMDPLNFTVDAHDDRSDATYPAME